MLAIMPVVVIFPPSLCEAGSSLDEHLEKLIRALGEAINDTVHESAEVSAALERIRAAGYDVFLVLEATIALKEKATESEAASLSFKEIPVEERLAEISDEDRRFLRALKIKFDNEE